jgi:hypothetical protein
LSAWSTKEIIQRQQAAALSRTRMQLFINEAMDFGMPWARDPRRGRQVFDLLFDSSGPWGAQKFSGRLQQDLTPTEQNWWGLEAGPLVPQPHVEAVNRSLEVPTNIVRAALNASSFPKAAGEMYTYLSMGTGALLMNEGDDRAPIQCYAVPSWRGLDFEEGPLGNVENVFWEKRYPAWQLARKWPKAKWPTEIQKLIEERSTQKIPILQASYYDDEIRGWRGHVIVRNLDADVWQTTYRANPWIIPRWWTTPGSTWGIGPMMLSLPDIKTANKMVEMILKAAAYQLAPPLMVMHDGVVNPDTLRLTPHALIRVARTGGNLGRSIEPLDLGSKVDLGQLVLQDIRQNIQRNLLARELPPATGAVRSPTEIIQRMKELQEDAGPAFGRVIHEFVPPVIARAIDILDRKKVAGVSWNMLQIDHLALKVKVTSPLAMQQKLNDVQTTVQWMELAGQIGGPQLTMMVSDVESALVNIAFDMGVKGYAVRPQADRAKLQQAAGAIAAHQATPGGALAPPTNSASVTDPTSIPGLVQAA